MDEQWSTAQTEAEAAIWERAVADLVQRGRDVSAAIAAADALLRTRRARIREGLISVAAGKPSSRWSRVA